VLHLRYRNLVFIEDVSGSFNGIHPLVGTTSITSPNISPQNPAKSLAMFHPNKSKPALECLPEYLHEGIRVIDISRWLLDVEEDE
jgi:hypothetical protein